MPSNTWRRASDSYPLYIKDENRCTTCGHPWWRWAGVDEEPWNGGQVCLRCGGGMAPEDREGRRAAAEYPVREQDRLGRGRAVTLDDLI